MSGRNEAPVEEAQGEPEAGDAVFLKCYMSLFSPLLGFEPEWHISGFSLSKSPDEMR